MYAPKQGWVVHTYPCNTSHVAGGKLRLAAISIRTLELTLTTVGA